MEKINNILAAITFSEYSIPALHYASFLSSRVNASLHILNVVNHRDIEAAAVYTRLIGSTPGSIEEFKKHLIEIAEDKVNEILHEKGRDIDNLKVKTAIKVGDPAVEILTYINDNDIDLAVLARSGKEKEKPILSRTGSVADKVFRNCPVPVLFI